MNNYLVWLASLLIEEGVIFLSLIQSSSHLLDIIEWISNEKKCNSKILIKLQNSYVCTLNEVPFLTFAGEVKGELFLGYINSAINVDTPCLPPTSLSTLSITRIAYWRFNFNEFCTWFRLIGRNCGSVCVPA